MSPKMILALSVIGVIIITNAFTAYHAFDMGKTVKQNEWNEAIIASTDKKLDTAEKQNEVRTAPIDNTVTDRRLLNGSF